MAWQHVLGLSSRTSWASWFDLNLPLAGLGMSGVVASYLTCAVLAAPAADGSGPTAVPVAGLGHCLAERSFVVGVPDLGYVLP